MGLKCGIVGLPNAGKSTIFNALTSSQGAEAGNYPFCTIDPNIGTVPVPDLRLEKISSLIKPEKTCFNTLEFVDIAGLVKGASQGEGLGNQFLSHIRSTDSLLQVVRGFKDSQITHVYGDTDPKRDIEIINTELLLSDLEMASKRFQKIEKTAQTTGDKKLKAEKEVLKRVIGLLESNQALRCFDWSQQEMLVIKPLNFITLKPILYVCNQSEKDFKENNESEQIIRNLCNKKEEVLSVCCSLEADMAEWNEEEKKEMLSSLNLKEPSLNRIIRKVYEQLQLLTFFTAGPKEVRAWTLKQNSLAPQAAGVIHSDFEKGFIRAETYSYEDLFKHACEKKLKSLGLIRSEGKSYQVKDGDIMHFLFNV